jgi:hypothetical protein
VKTLTPEELSARTARALEAAIGAGRDLGLDVREGRVLHDVFSVLVHLEPSPVVVRVPVVLPPGLDLAAQRARQARELSVVGWLALNQVPVIAPSPLVPPEPVVRDGFSMTFWELVEIDRNEHAWAESAAPVARAHAALSRHPGSLPFLSPLAITIEPCLNRLRAHPELIGPEDLARATREWAALEAVCTSPEAFIARHQNAPLQVIHGDAPYYNTVWTPAGPLVADFEDTTLGPIEWDLASAGSEVLARYDAAAVEAGGRPHDPDALRTMEAARMLQVVACFALVPELPLLGPGLTPFLDQWRASAEWRE